MMNYGYGGPFGHYSIFSYGGITMMILFVAVIALVVYLLVKNRSFTTGDHNFPPEADALNILKQRFAAGEIDEAEFLKIKEKLLS